MTMQKLAQVRVKRNGQVTIPSELRVRLGIDEGAILAIAEQKGTIMLRPAPPLKGGKVVGKATHKQIIDELDQLRRDWR